MEQDSHRTFSSRLENCLYSSLDCLNESCSLGDGLKDLFPSYCQSFSCLFETDDVTSSERNGFNAQRCLICNSQLNELNYDL